MASVESIGELVRRLRKERGLNQKQLALYSGVSRSWVAAVENGTIARPRPDLLQAIAPRLNVAAASLLSAAGYPTESAPELLQRSPREIALELLATLNRQEQAVYAVPVSGIASAGPGGLQDDYGFVGQPQLRPELRMLTVTGSCMAPLIHPGDVVVVDTEASYREGSIVAATRGEQVIVKRFHDKELRGEDGTVERAIDWTIVGVVIRFQRPLE